MGRIIVIASILQLGIHHPVLAETASTVTITGADQTALQQSISFLGNNTADVQNAVSEFAAELAALNFNGVAVGINADLVMWPAVRRFASVGVGVEMAYFRNGTDVRRRSFALPFLGLTPFGTNNGPPVDGSISVLTGCDPDSYSGYFATVSMGGNVSVSLGVDVEKFFFNSFNENNTPTTLDAAKIAYTNYYTTGKTHADGLNEANLEEALGNPLWRFANPSTPETYRLVNLINDARATQQTIPSPSTLDTDIAAIRSLIDDYKNMPETTLADQAAKRESLIGYYIPKIGNEILAFEERLAEWRHKIALAIFPIILNPPDRALFETITKTSFTTPGWTTYYFSDTDPNHRMIVNATSRFTAYQLVAARIRASERASRLYCPADPIASRQRFVAAPATFFNGNEWVNTNYLIDCLFYHLPQHYTTAPTNQGSVSRIFSILDHAGPLVTALNEQRKSLWVYSHTLNNVRQQFQHSLPINFNTPIGGVPRETWLGGCGAVTIPMSRVPAILAALKNGGQLILQGMFGLSLSTVREILTNVPIQRMITNKVSLMRKLTEIAQQKATTNNMGSVLTNFSPTFSLSHYYGVCEAETCLPNDQILLNRAMHYLLTRQAAP